MTFFTRTCRSTRPALLLGALLTVGSAAAQDRWARQAGGAGQDDVRNLAVDERGNAYVMGRFTGPAQFGDLALDAPAAGTGGAFLARYDAQGTPVWVQAAPVGSFSDAVTDAAGNLYVVGSFSGSVAFGSFSLNSQGTADLVLAKYDAQGQVLWARQGGSTPGSSLGGQGVALDAAGNPYVTGTLLGSANVGGSAAGMSSEGPASLFVAKFSAQGEPAWAQQGGSKNATCGGAALGLDGAGNIYVVGGYSGPAVFGAVGLVSSSPGGNGGVLLVKCSARGEFLWARGEGGPGYALANDVAVDTQGNSYITGTIGGTPEKTSKFGPFALVENAFDGYLVKHDAAGTVQWASQIGGNTTDYGTSVAVDAAGNAYVAGVFGSAPATFGPGTKLSSSGGRKNVFAAKYSPQGNVLAVQREGACGSAYYPAIAVTAGQQIYLAGSFVETGSFVSTLFQSKGEDVFVARLGDLSTPSTPR